MPSNECIWLHDGEGRTPFDEPREHDECETSRVAGATRLDLAFQVQRQLFAQEEILGGETRAESQAEPDEPQQIDHETENGADHHQCAMIPRINRAGIVARQRGIAASSWPDRIFADHNGASTTLLVESAADLAKKKLEAGLDSGLAGRVALLGFGVDYSLAMTRFGLAWSQINRLLDAIDKRTGLQDELRFQIAAQESRRSGSPPSAIS